MKTVNALLSKRWILKREDRDLYYQIKDHAKALRSFFQDKLGFSLTVHQHYIRLDKIPGKAEPWMGITEFQSVLEYQMLCYILVFLEDKEDEEQFILSSLTEFIQLQLGVNEEYWLKFSHRRKLVNVLKFCLKEQLIVQDDGHSENFMQNQETEALFENTGLSRYLMRYFTMDIFDYQKPSDFMTNNAYFEEKQDRGSIRSQRIYRRLLLSCGIYREDEKQNDDFSYIKNYRKRIENDFNQLFNCDLQVYHSSAFLILDDEVRFGQLFPKNNALDELLILVCSALRQQITTKKKLVNQQEIYVDTKENLYKMMQRHINKNLKYMPATYRQKSLEQLTEEVYQRLLMLGFGIEVEGQVHIYPIIAKFMGQFEEDDA